MNAPAKDCSGIPGALKKSLALLCGVAAAAIGLNAFPASAGPISLSDLRLNGNGPPGDPYPRLIDGGSALRLLPNYDLNDPAHPTDGLASAGAAPAASAWYPAPLPVRDGFTTTFEFRMSDQTGGWDWLGGYGAPNPPDGADGISFVIQTQGLGAMGVGAGGVGYGWMTHGVALEFDTWKNAPWVGDPDDNHISLKFGKSVDENILAPHHKCINATCVPDPTIVTGHRCTPGGTDGILTSTQCTTDYPHFPGDLVTDFWKTDTKPYRCGANPEVASVGSLTIDLNDGAWHTVKVEYAPGSLKVYLDNLTGQPVLTKNVDLGQLLDLPCDGTAIVGFTSGERGGYQNHDIRLWDYEGAAVRPLAADFTYSPDPVHAGDTVQFNASASGGEPPYSYSWDFGDGTTSAELSPTHTYPAAGTYTVKLTVTPSRCAPVTVEKTFTIRVPDQCPPGGGGLTPGFWSSKNGAKLVGPDDLAMLAGLNLKDVKGFDFDPTSHSQLRAWLHDAGAANMASMLSAQLAAMELNVFNGNVNGEASISAPGIQSARASGYVTVNAVMAEANAELGLHPLTPSGDSNRAYQEALKNALDEANNNRNFVGPVPCDF